jgi:type IV pilus assembly protein PilC
MKLYYHAVTQDGTTIRGLIEAKNVEEAAHSLRLHQLTPIKIIPSRQKGIARFFPFLQRVSSTDLIFFTQQLSSMLISGLTLMQALSIMKNEAQNPMMAEIIQTIVTDLEDGKAFSSAIEKYPQLFSPIYISLVRTAESGGLIDKILTRLGQSLENQNNLRQTIKGALLYPAIVVGMMIIVIFIMMIFVVPQLSTLYENFQMELPLPTQIVIDISNFTILFWPYIIIISVLLIYYFRTWYKKESGKRKIDSLVLKMPVFGKLIMESSMADFTRTLSLLIGSGALVVDSLIKSADVIDNMVYKDEIGLVARRVEKGITVGDALEVSHIFPFMVIEMVKIGEQTGKLNESLMKTSEYFEREVENTVKTLTTLMQPLILLLLALGVGFLVFAIITPIYKLMSSIQ